jgi:hypothetical protein
VHDSGEIRLTPENELLFEKIFGRGRIGRIATIGSHQIDRLTVPKGWEIAGGHSHLAGRTRFSGCRPIEHRGGVEISIYTSNSRLSHEDITVFQSVLKREPHTLPASELTAIANVLQQTAHPHAFKIMVARTTVLNCRTVLMVEGRYMQHNVDSVILYSLGANGRVEEVSYTAPSHLYNSLRISAKRAFDSIVWKQDKGQYVNN